MRNYLQHHQVVLVKRVLAFERDDHTVGDRVAGHHHATVLDSVLVDGNVERIGRYDVHVCVFRAYPVLHHVGQFEWIVTELSLSGHRILLVEVKNL